MIRTQSKILAVRFVKRVKELLKFSMILEERLTIAAHYFETKHAKERTDLIKLFYYGFSVAMLHHSYKCI